MTALNDTMFARPPVYVRRCDLPELSRIAKAAQTAETETPLFLQELERFSIAPDATPDRFVRLGSSVLYKDLRTKRQRLVRLVHPGSENYDENEVSLLSPIGGALVGLVEGSIFRWSCSDGRLRAIKVLEITHEEER